MAKTKKTKPEENSVKLTQQTYDDLVKELDHRKNVQRIEIAEEIAAARALGDLSENHAYTVAMEKKEMNENRINELDEILAIAEVITVAADYSSDDIVSVGETVEIQNLENKQKRVVILVGSEESKSANPQEGKISTDSPIGRAIYNSKIGEQVDVVLPSKKVPYKILRFVKQKAA